VDWIAPDLGIAIPASSLMANAHALEDGCRPIVEEMISHGGAMAIAVASSYGNGADRVYLDSPN
jgi:glycerol dehydrogenase-like iron-containing ADH family enzyme